MINPLHIVWILSFLAGWHLDAIDQALIERHRPSLGPLNTASEQAAIIAKKSDRFTVLEVKNEIP